MTYYSISALINFSVSLLLGIFVLYKNHRARLNRSLSFWCLTVASWSFFYFIWQLETQAERALLWTRLLMVGAVWVPIAYFRVVVIFLDIEKIYKKFIYFNYALAALFTALLATPLMITYVEPMAGFPFWPKPGLAYALFLTMFLGLSAYAAYLSLRAIKTETSPIKRAQIKYMLLGIAISIAGGSTNYFLWYNIPIKPYGNLLASTYVVFTIYAILRYRLMDIRIVVRKVFLYIIAAIFIYGAFYLIIWLEKIFLGGAYNKNAYLIGTLFALIFVGLFKVFNNFIIKLANRYLFFTLYNYQETINKLSQELTYYTDLNKIIDTIVNTIKKTMRLDRAGVLLINTQVKPAQFQISKVIGFNKQNGIGLVQDNFLTKYLEKTQKLLVADELSLLAQDAQTKENKDGFLRMKKYMARIEASLCLPLVSGKKLIGIITLGAKISGDAYSKEDLDLLTILSSQAGIAINNARLYKESQAFNKTLQGKVDEQTKYLKELLEMKNDFLRVVNHQLNTPLSVMKGYFSMMKEGSYQTDKAVPAIERGLERISSTVADFWDAYELEGERMKMEPQKTDITEIVDKLIPEKQKLQLAQERKLTIAVEKPKFKMPLVWCDYKKIAHVISNLLDNAVYYTRKGKVTIYYELLNDNYLKVNVKDTGVGISVEDKENLFQKFSRGDHATDLHPDGSGLGLFIAKKIIEGNLGEISYFSEGKDQGSTFSFTVPIYKNQPVEVNKEKPISRKKIVIFNQA